MILQDLGYCCLWFFFTRFRKNRVVADRLGVSRQAVSVVRRDCKVCSKCEERPNCMHKLVTMQLTARRPPGPPPK